LHEDETLSPSKKKSVLQDFVRNECNNQQAAPSLLICERFVPDGPLHGKCSAVLALNLAILDIISSRVNNSKVILSRIVKVMNNNQLSAFADTIQKKYIDEDDTKYQFRLIGPQANILLSSYQKVIVREVVSYYNDIKEQPSPLLKMKLECYAFCCMKLRQMSAHWEILIYTVKKKDEEKGNEKENEDEKNEGWRLLCCVFFSSSHPIFSQINCTKRNQVSAERSVRLLLVSDHCPAVGEKRGT